MNRQIGTATNQVKGFWDREQRSAHVDESLLRYFMPASHIMVTVVAGAELVG
jgi:hypothetical protein